MAASSSREVQHGEGDVCWICLEEGSSQAPLSCPCTCPRLVHGPCLARWQLQSAGRREERFCRFCSSNLPDWRTTLTAGEAVRVPPVMTVVHDNKVFVIPVQPGPHGLEEFQENIRQIFGYDQQVEINFSFGCTVPGSEAGEMLNLEGFGAFDAAVHCAAVSTGVHGSRNKRKRDAPPSALGPVGPSTPAPFLDGDVDVEMGDQEEASTQRRRTSSRQAANKRAVAAPVPHEPRRIGH